MEFIPHKILSAMAESILVTVVTEGMHVYYKLYSTNDMYVLENL